MALSGIGRRIGESGRWIQAAYCATDVFFVVVSALAVYSLRFGSGWVAELLAGDVAEIPQFRYLGFLVLYASLVVLFCQAQDLYWTPRHRSTPDEAFAVCRAILFANAVFIAFIYLAKQDISRTVVGLTGLLNVCTLAGWRAGKRRVVEQRVRRGIGVRNAVIVGGGRVGRELAAYLEANRHLGVVVKGFIDGNHSAGARLLGTIEGLPGVMLSHFIDEVFITPPADGELVNAVVTNARRLRRVRVNVVPEFYRNLGLRATLQYLGDFPILPVQAEPIPVLGLFAKRLIDKALSAVGLIILSPLLLVIAVAVKLDSFGPVLYRSSRIGKKGIRFACYKFRTMVENADALKHQLRHLNQRRGPFFKVVNDPRVTRIGKFLRKYSLDELPQLWNVLKGDMSLVGPRPHPTDDFEQYRLKHLRRLEVTPGITGLWQISARQDPSFETNLALDLKYIEDWSLWMDIKILLKTPPAVLKGLGQ